MKNIAIPSLIAIAVLLSACGGSDAKNKKPDVVEPVASVFAKYQGIWELPGTGNLWQIDNEHFSSYNFNSYGCVKTDSAQLDDIEAAASLLSIDNNQLRFSGTGSNDQVFISKQQLPENCQQESLLSQTDPETNFEYFWHTMNDYYAFFETRNIDWQLVYDEYRPLITSSTTKQEFFEIIEDIISTFGDSHLALYDGDDEDVSGDALNGFILEVLRSSVVDAEEDFAQAWQELMNYNDQVVAQLLQEHQLNSYQDSNAIRWGKLADNLGYLRIDRVQNINDSEEQDGDNFLDTLALISQDLADTDIIMQTALADFTNSDALIIDLRYNGGGFDNIALKIASYFSDKEQVIATKSINNRNYQGDNYELKLTKSPIAVFDKPVYVITGRSTGSGGEVLSMALKALPQVTMIGEPTNGSVSDVLDHQLPNGWALTLSNEVYRDSEGKVVERIGVTPEVEMPVYATQDLLYYSNTPIDYVLQATDAITDTTPSKAEVDQAFEQYFVPTKIPGVAVAIIKNDKIVYQKAHGLANIEQDIAITMDTPFNVGSISKAMLAAGIMQQVEQGNISLDDKLTEMNLSFNPNNPANTDESDGITLRHLVTHTSGIRDSDGYGCSYYLHENNRSLYRLYGVEECPEFVPVEPTTFFATEYFNENGRYVMNGIYNEDEDGFPNKTHQYSNIGAGLAGYAVEQKLNIDFSEVMQQQIFTPLNMNNTAWHHTELNPNNAKAVQYSLDTELNPIAVPEFSYPTFYDGDLNISASDLARFLIAITQGGQYQGTRILAQETVEAMLSSQTEVLNQRDTQGVFWYRHGAYIGHSGGDPGTNAIMQYNTATKTGLVVLMNGEDGYVGNDELDEQLMPLLAALYRYGLAQ
ncbi:hypothetical protein tinsulaeT_12830 [Thalassotalea insulae]|uniref:Tail specific protease domain-containing protein n=1 Tax=Thalassotalea insulae TaxID=2056778 RepID=A0ABQ6GPN7_9GAMM|nr:serine hydrolase [Thalassotalea insulae]GLX77943.1 hypothetical protein tinsulaeT_12830 [Thalassotalea insulae]